MNLPWRCSSGAGRRSATPDGELLYRLAHPLVDGVDRLHETFRAHQGHIEAGELNIAAGESTILYILPGPMKQLAEDYPGVRLKLHNVTGRDGLAMLRADTADLAVGSMLDVPEDIVYHPVVSFDPALITPLDHPLARLKQVTLQDISPYGLILPPRPLSGTAADKVEVATDLAMASGKYVRGGFVVVETAELAGDSVTTYHTTVAHGLGTTPTLNNIELSIYISSGYNSGDVPAFRAPYVETADGTNITIYSYVIDAGATGTKYKVVARIFLT